MVLIRHLVERRGVGADGMIRDPRSIRHGLIVGRRVAALAGAIDPATHLNLIYPHHRADRCIVVECFEVGADVLLDGDQFATAEVDPALFVRRPLAQDAEHRLAWISRFAERRGS